jgi:hypothetical protein
MELIQQHECVILAGFCQMQDPFLNKTDMKTGLQAYNLGFYGISTLHQPHVYICIYLS